MPQRPLADPVQRSQRLRGVALGLPATAFLLATLIGFNAAQTASLAIRPFSRRRFRAFNRFAADTWWGWCMILAERLQGIHLELSGDDVPAAENALVVVNHQQMPDITFLMAFARSKGRLGDLKWFVKEPLKYVPGVGWGMQFLDCVFVSRSWSSDERSIARTFDTIKRDRVPLWLVSFVEGTRITPRKVAGSQHYARQQGIPTTDHVLVPRTKGFCATLRGLSGHLNAVYDVTIGYPEGVPTLWQYIKGYAKVAHLHVKRTAVADLPPDDQGRARWLLDQFVDKDRLLEQYYRTGHF